MIWFIGAGPGDPELITVKGLRVLKAADIIIYAGSLVNKELLTYAKPQAKVYNSACMTLEEVLAVMMEGTRAGCEIARVHTGDPSIYGAIREQMDALDAVGIAYQNIPGVSSFLGAAASLHCEYTLPGVSQTVILTRLEGRTAVPETERIADLASHHATMIIFLSVDRIEEVCTQLLTGYTLDTPAAVVCKATWTDETIVRGTLADIAQKTRAARIMKTALILVGDFLGNDYELSRLYDQSFTTGFRKGRAPK